MLQPEGEPWGLELVGGGTCVFVVGATDGFRGERLNYACTKVGWIFGFADRSTAVWTAHCVDYPNQHVTRVRISTAIF